MNKKWFYFLVGIVLVINMLLMVACSFDTENNEVPSTPIVEEPPKESITEDVDQFEIIFANYDGTVLETITIDKGQTPAYTKNTPQRQPSNGYTYIFKGWAPNVVVATSDVKYVATYLEIRNADYYTKSENDIYFGLYPQTLIEDSQITEELTLLAGELPTESNPQQWTDYKYYKREEEASFMWYIDLPLGSKVYRGVYFISERPGLTWQTDSSYQHSMGYFENEIYWFEFELIKWTILEEEGGKALLLSDIVLDSQDYYQLNNANQIARDDEYGYSNNYKLSRIRQWLNNDFYNTAFSDIEKAIVLTAEVDNSVESTNETVNQYVCANTNDKVFLLSSYDVITYFQDNGARQTSGSDYAKAQGLYCDAGCFWWTRSPSRYNPRGARCVGEDGNVDYESYFVYLTYEGVRPACYISL